MRGCKLGAGGMVLWTALKDFARTRTGRIRELWVLVRYWSGNRAQELVLPPNIL